jgi:hypothetical protein
MQQPEHGHAYSRDEQANQEIPNNKTLEHLADQPERHKRSVPVMERKQHHGSGPGVALPGKQKISKKRNK